MAAEIEKVAERLEHEPAPEPAPMRSAFPRAPATLAERIRNNPPPPGVRRFYNTKFRMPERPRRGD